MIAFPEMLVPAAQKAGMKIPENPSDFDTDEYPHFRVFSNVQLGVPIPYVEAVFNNACLIAKYNKDEIKSVTLKTLLENGFQVG